MNNRLSTFLLIAAPLFAAAPVATVTAGAGLTINGKPIPAAGAPNWPVAAGDTLVTADAPASLAFPDGARLALAPHTRVALQHCDRCVAQLFEGAVDYDKPAGSNFELCVVGRLVRPAAGTQGSVVVEGPDKVVVKTPGGEQLSSEGKCACNAGAPWATPGMSGKTKAAIVIAAAGGGATATTIALTKPDKKSKKN